MVLVAEPFAVFEFGLALVLPMAFLATIHAAAFRFVMFVLFAGEFLEFLAVL